MKLTDAVEDMYELLQKRAREGDIEAYELMCRVKEDTPEKIKPCPFCGGKAEPYKDDEEWVHIKCRECWNETDGHTTLDTAMEFWNKRTETRPQGRWLQHDEEDTNAWKCSICHEVWQLMDGTPKENGMKYCQRCGAEMTLDDLEAVNAPK